MQIQKSASLKSAAMRNKEACAVFSLYASCFDYRPSSCDICRCVKYAADTVDVIVSVL